MGNPYENVGQFAKLPYRFSFHLVSDLLMKNPGENDKVMGEFP